MLLERGIIVKVNNKKILFLSYNKHQYKLFSFLVDNLQPGLAVHLTGLNSLIKGMFTNRVQPLSQEVINQIAHYSFLKFKARREKNEKDFINRIYYKYLCLKTKSLYQYYYRYFSDNNIGLAVVWNGHHIEAASCVEVARLLGIKTIFMENGFFPQTIVIDEKGVNAANSLAGKGADFYQKVQIEPEKLAQLKETKLQQRELRKKFYGKEEMKFPKQFFFLPFQVHTDTQVLLNSPYIKNMYDLVDTVYSSLEEFNHKNNEDYWLVVKEHPSDFGRIDYSNLKKKYQKKNVVFITTALSSELIELSRAVITINSTVGIEALLKRKAVITLGEAFYNVEGLVYHCTDLSRLHDYMGKAVSDKTEYKLVDKFLYFLRYEYLIEVDKKHLTKKNILPVINRIKEVWEK